MLGLKIKRERVPCVHEISFKNEDCPVLLLRLHKDFVEAKKDLIPTASFIDGIRKEHNLGEFSPLKEEYFGFDKAIKKSKIVGDFIEFEIKIPVFAKKTEKLCDRCKGTGIDKFFKRECSFCEGGKYEIFYDWKSFDAISASLQILMMMTDTFDQVQSQSCQLLTFQIHCGKGQGHYPIGGHYGISFCDWLSSFPDHHQFNEVIKTMKDVYSYIHQRKFSGWDFQAYVSGDAWLVISVPGNACGIFPEDGGYKPGQGREFSCHNMDTPIQQVILLVALAVLSDMAREYYKARSK